MVELTSYSAPENGIVHKESLTEAFVKDKSIGNGTLYITESDVTWIGGEGSGIKLAYPNISIHAVSRDTSTFPHQCLFLMLDIALEEPLDEGSAEEDSEEEPSTEVRFVPSNKEHLDVMYRAMCSCQELHPDPEQDDSDGEFFGEDECSGGDGLQLSAQGMENLARMEQMLSDGSGENGNHQPENMEYEDRQGQFEDA